MKNKHKDIVFINKLLTYIYSYPTFNVHSVEQIVHI